MSDLSPIAAAQDLAELIREQRAHGDAQARLTQDVVHGCGCAGLFRMSAPKEVGGLETRLSDMILATETVSRADPAVGWYVQNSMMGWRAAAQLRPETRAEVYVDQNKHFGNASQNQGLATRVEGGYLLSGTWPVVTGVEDSDWTFMVGTLTENGEPRLIDGIPDTRNFLVPTSKLEIRQTWQNVSAMRGTGSNMVKAEDVFVPDELAVGIGTPWQIDRPYNRTPTLVFLMPVVGAVVLGALGEVIDTVARVLSNHTAAFTGEARRNQAASQELIARCRAQHRAMRAGLLDVASAIDDTLARDQDPAPTLRAEAYASSMHAVDACRQLASDLFAGGTRDGFVRNNPVEMGLRDLHAIGYVMASARFIMHSAGRVMLGGEHDPGL